MQKDRKRRLLKLYTIILSLARILAVSHADFLVPPLAAVDLLVTLLIGLTAGACGALVGNPAEIGLIRMSADGA